MFVLLSVLLLLLSENGSQWGHVGENTLIFTPVQTIYSTEFERLGGASAYNGTLYALDCDAHCVHMMNPKTGAYIGRFGCKGEGPGEFRFVRFPKFGKVGDSIFVVDGDLISRFKLDGSYIGRERLPSKYGHVIRINPLINGSYLLLVGNHDQESGMNKDRVLIWEPRTDKETELGVLRGNRYQWTKDCWRFNALGDQFTFFTIDDSRTIAYARNHAPKIHLLSLRGKPAGEIKIPWETYPITKDERELHRTFYAGGFRRDGHCREFVAEGSPAFFALVPFKEYFLVGKYQRFDGLFDVRVLNRSGEILGAGRHVFGENGNFSEGDDGYFYATGIDPKSGDWRIERLRVTLEPRK